MTPKIDGSNAAIAREQAAFVARDVMEAGHLQRSRVTSPIVDFVEHHAMTDLTNPVAIEIARLLAYGEDKYEVIFTLATKFPDVTLTAFDETLRDVVALQSLVAAELAEWKHLKPVNHPKRLPLSAGRDQSAPPKWGCRSPTFH